MEELRSLSAHITGTNTGWIPALRHVVYLDDPGDRICFGSHFYQTPSQAESALLALHRRIAHLVDVEMDSLAQLHSPEQLRDRVTAFHETLESLDKGLNDYRSWHSHSEFTILQTEAYKTHAFIGLARILDPLHNGEVSGHTIHKYCQNALPNLELPRGCLRLAARVLLGCPTNTYLTHQVLPLKAVEGECAQAFRPDAQWPITLGRDDKLTVFQAVVLVRHNLLDFDALDPPSAQALLALDKLHGIVCKDHGTALPKILFDLYARGISKLLTHAQNLVSTGDFLAFGALRPHLMLLPMSSYDPAWQCRLTPLHLMRVAITHMITGAVTSVNLSDQLKCAQAAQLFSTLGWSDTATHSALLDKLLCDTTGELFAELEPATLDPTTLEYLNNGLRTPDLLQLSERALERLRKFYIHTWPSKTIARYSPGVVPDLTLQLAGGATIEVHAVLLARTSNGMLSALRDPCCSINQPFTHLDLSAYNPEVVARIVRLAYGLPVSYLTRSSVLYHAAEQLTAGLYGISIEELGQLRGLPVPLGRDSLTDLTVLCKAQQTQCAHRAVLAHFLNKPVDDVVDWRQLDIDEATALLEFIYTREPRADTIDQLTSAAATLGLPQVNTLVAEHLKQATAELKVRFSQARPVCPYDYELYPDPHEVLAESNRLLVLLESLGPQYAGERGVVESVVSEGRHSWSALDQSWTKPHNSVRFAWQRLKVCEALGRTDLIEARRTRVIELVLDVPQGAVRLPASAHGQTLDLGEVALSDVQQGNLADCLGNNPRFMVALRGTNVGDDFVELLMDRGYSVDSLYWEGCTGISPAVMQLLRFEIPSADHLQVITPVIRRLACRGTIEMQAAIIPHLIPKNGQWTLELRGFTIIGSAESALLSALKDIAPYEKVIDLRGASVRRECLNELGHWQCVVDQTTDIVEPSPRKTSLT